MSAVLYESRSGYHYILVGPQYLSWKANKRGIDMRLIELADRVNRNTPTYVTHRIMTLLNESDVSMLEAAILVIGVAYKPNVFDIREAPALDIIDILEDYDTSIRYHDPYVEHLEIDESVHLMPDLLADQDCVVILTTIPSSPSRGFSNTPPLVFDTRNATYELTNMDTDTVHRL